MTAEQECLQLLSKENRPFNVQNVADLLATRGVKKSQAEKALAKLASSGKVACKEFGKTKIYFASQEDLPTLSENEIKVKMVEIEGVKNECQVKGAAVSGLLQDYNKYKSRSTLEQMKEEYQSLQNEAEELDEKLADVRGAGAKQVSSEDIQQVEKAIQKYIGTWKSRKRSFKNVWSHVSENFDGNQKALFEDLGIDEDGEMELMKIEEAVNNKKRKALS